MYVIAMLCMLKIYHTRHPDINASAYATFGVLALIILVGVAGILAGTLHFFISFTVIHLSMCLWLSGKVYYVGRFGFGELITSKMNFLYAVNSLCVGFVAIRHHRTSRLVVLPDFMQ